MSEPEAKIEKIKELLIDIEKQISECHHLLRGNEVD